MNSIDPLQRNAVTVLGNKDAAITMVFIPGFGSDQSVWHPVARAFFADFRVVLLDNAGTGSYLHESFQQSHYLNMTAYADDVLEICAELKAKQIILVGHSMGSMISILAANKQASLIDKLILIGASPRYLNDGDYFGGFTQRDLDELYTAITLNFDNWLDGFAKLAMGSSHEPSLAEKFADAIRGIPRAQMLTALCAIFQTDHRADVEKIDTPTLLIQAKDDVFVPFAVAQYLHKSIRGSSLNIIDADGHLPHVSAPQKVIDAIADFV